MFVREAELALWTDLHASLRSQSEEKILYVYVFWGNTHRFIGQLLLNQL